MFYHTPYEIESNTDNLSMAQLSQSCKQKDNILHCLQEYLPVKNNQNPFSHRLYSLVEIMTSNRIM